MNKLTTLVIGILFLNITAFASGNISGYDDPLKVNFIKNSKKQPDYGVQQLLRQQSNWVNFLQNHGHWNVIFDENNAMPQRAFGAPIAIAGSDARAKAMNFLSSNLREFNIPISDLQFKSVSTGNKYQYVNYSQFYNGIEVLFTNVQVKFNTNNFVMQYALECHPDINISTQPQISSATATQKAIENVAGVQLVSLTPEMKILPVPSKNKYNHRLVYEFIVENRDSEGFPGKYYTLIDAISGEVLYRVNKVAHVSANTDVNVTGSLYLTHPYNPVTTEPLKNMKIVENGITYFTNNTGYLGLANSASTSATFSMEGRWSKVRTNGITPSWSVALNPGQNNIGIDVNTDIRQRSAYNAIDHIHDYMKTKFPLFTGLDVSFDTNVDLAGSCNAFYDGNSVNFFAAGGGCNPTALIADVCYHEYGHGINDKFYQSIGANFQNGAMGEGYGDIWALSITGSPILGIGFYTNNATGFVRRYDINKKVYPQNLVGQVHADGEIIAGCFWDTYLNLGNMQQMMDLFSQSYFAGITGPDGNEGVIFQNILLEVLTLDDNDGDLTNGTPNYCAITSAFAIHGINLGAAVNVTHNEVLQFAPFAPIVVNAVVQGLGVGSNVGGFYRVGNSGSYSPFLFSNTGGNNYEGNIPSQSNGTIVEYYIGVEDDCGTLTNILPANATATTPNIPYYIMVGFNLLVHEDFDVFSGNWIVGDPTDNATTGLWIIDVPIPSYIGNSVVQTGTQNTPGGLFCLITGNASGPTAGAGENDIDNGKTTVYSPEYDLSTYTNPAFTYYRWYTNDQGATPGTDFWQVAISGDGINYVPVENTEVSDHSWRRFAFKVLDYITPTSTVTIRFIGEDANAGSLVEVALDDIMLWDEIPVGLSEANQILNFSLYPNPANNLINFNIGLVKEQNGTITILNHLGQVVTESAFNFTAGNNVISLSTSAFSAGLYQAILKTNNFHKIQKFSVIK